ncbi:LysR family transcriptional regulator [Rhodococcus sp. O3]|uniref:LysR family transcriptional regulator n=1 Tax=Rhodococcus sp. O3 TaxID=3404919 RepID=UPI003B66C240
MHEYLSSTTRTELYDLRRVRQFLAVADHLNMTHAAQELQLTQQAVSGTIRSLERDLGVQLLHRIGRRLTLTPAGEVLRDGAMPLLHAAEALTRAARTVADDRETRVVVGYLSTITPDEVYALTEPIRSGTSPVTVVGRQLSSDEVEASLRTGHTDLVLRHGADDSPHFAHAVIGYSPLRVAFTADHRLAGRPAISVADLAEDYLVLPDFPGDQAHLDFLIGVCRTAGFEPRTVHSSVRGLAPTASVNDLDQYALVTAAPGPMHGDRIVVAELEGRPMAPVQALWLRHTDSPARQALLAHHCRDPSNRSNSHQTTTSVNHRKTAP